MIERGTIFWADLGEPVGSEPGKRRPVLVVQSDGYNRSSISTVIVVTLTSNTRLATTGGNVFLPMVATGLPKDSVANVSQLSTLNRFDLITPAGTVPTDLMRRVDDGLRTVLSV